MPDFPMNLQFMDHLVVFDFSHGEFGSSVCFSLSTPGDDFFQQLFYLGLNLIEFRTDKVSHLDQLMTIMVSLGLAFIADGNVALFTVGMTGLILMDGTSRKQQFV